MKQKLCFTDFSTAFWRHLSKSPLCLPFSYAFARWFLFQLKSSSLSSTIAPCQQSSWNCACNILVNVWLQRNCNLVACGKATQRNCWKLPQKNFAITVFDVNSLLFLFETLFLRQVIKEMLNLSLAVNLCSYSKRTATLKTNRLQYRQPPQKRHQAKIIRWCS